PDFIFAFPVSPTTEIYTLSLHDALPISALYCEFKCEEWFGADKMLTNLGIGSLLVTFYGFQHHSAGPYDEIDMYRDRSLYSGNRSEEHTFELQSRENLVCRLLLEKKKKK